MAGIGFELRRILAEDTYTSIVKGYLYSTVISSGPWLMSVLSLGLLGLLSVAFLGFEERQTFISTVVYMYAGSLVGTGVIQMVVTRYLADRLYQGDRAALADALPPVFVITLAIEGAMALAALWGAPLAPAYKVTAACGFLIIGLIWQSMVFLSASRDYVSIVLAFVVGSAVSFGAGYLWGEQYGLIGYLNGYVFGQGVIFTLLLLEVARDFGVPRRWDWAFLGYIRRYPALVGIGLFYNLSIWIDKLLFGLSSYGRVTADRFPTYNHYDSSMFLAFATVVPAMAYFLMRMETDFAEVYRRYYDDIFFRRSFDQIMASKRAMIAVLEQSFVELIKIQGLITFVVVYFADDILRALELPYSQTAMFRYGLIGAFMQVLSLFVQVVLLYFDLRLSVLLLTVVTFVAITIGTFASIQLGFGYYGAGFAAANYVALAAAVAMLYRRVGDLEFITFAKRRIVGQVTGGRAHRTGRKGLYGRYLPVPGDDKEGRG